MKCACNKDLIVLTARTERNYDRKFLKCAEGKCHVWLWQDLLENYVQERINLEKKHEDILRCTDEDILAEHAERLVEHLRDLELRPYRKDIIGRPRPCDSRPTYAEVVKGESSNTTKVHCPNDEWTSGDPEVSLDEWAESCLDLQDYANDDQWRRA
uniref:Zinc finger GRF-type domain-containing protein n=1 Tax=Arundo donax TaxID=35708 RepID=A0A0A8ZCK1_ARUDO